jgi:hypothetical protein
MRSIGRYHWPLYSAFTVLSATPVVAQSPNVGSHIGIGEPTVVAPGDTIHVLDFSIGSVGHDVVRPGTWYEIHYVSRIAASDSLARHAEADRAAAFFGPRALQAGFRGFSIGLCDSLACAEKRESAKVWYFYKRGEDEVWRRAAAP